MKRFWIILAGAFALAAVILFLRHEYEKAFISAAVGAVSWFLGYRAQMQEIVKVNQTETDENLESNEEV